MKLIGVLLAVPSLLITSVVGVQTYHEYETWQDQEWGVLEHVFAVTTAALPPVPDWTCVDPPSPIAPGSVRVKTFWGLEEPQSERAWWAQEVTGRLPIALTFDSFERSDVLEDAHAYADQHRDQVVLVFTDRHYRGPVLNDRLEGFACGNIAVINIEIDCPESIVAHEIGHVLGLRHTGSGLMRARAVTCDDRLVPQQTLWLNQHYVPLDQGILPPLGAELADLGPLGNADAEPAKDSRIL